MKQSTLWRISTLVSIILLAVLIYIWTVMNSYTPEAEQLENNKIALNYLNKHWENHQQGDSNKLVKIKTGIFIQSMQFYNSNDVNLTGYIWQRYSEGQRDSLGLDSLEVGFILPEQVNTGSDIVPREEYRIYENNEELIGWYFEATLRQPFDYSSYPFDHQEVWIRMWPKNFSDNVVLIPDFEAYPSTRKSDLFGIEENIVLGEWNLKNTFFDYIPSSYNTDFGILNYKGQKEFPELHFNIVVKRKVENAFFVHILPIFLVAVLLFAALLTVSYNEKLTTRLGFNVINFIAASSALLFAIVISHIQLRKQFEGTETVYIDYFYILMYVVMVILNVNVYLFSVSEGRSKSLIQYNDNLIIKVAFWPFILSSLILISLMFI